MTILVRPIRCGVVGCISSALSDSTAHTSERWLEPSNFGGRPYTFGGRISTLSHSGTVQQIRNLVKTK